VKKLIFLCLILALTLALVITGCSSSSSPTTSTPATTAPNTTTAKPQSTTAQSTTIATTIPAVAKPKSGGTLRIAESMPPTSSIGWLAEPTFLAGAWLSPMVEPLLEVSFTNTVKPKLATDFQIAPDLKSIKLTLRKGVKFHDGTDFNAAAAKWNLEQQIAAKLSSTADWVSVDAIDDYTIQINLKNYQNSILNNLGSYPGMMISPTAFQKNGGAEGMRWNPVGTGPFKFVSYTKGASMKYTRFNDYWDTGKPYLDAIEMTFIADPMTRWASFAAGEQDATNGAMNYTESEILQKGYSIIKNYSGIAELVPDSKNASSPFANLKVRQALDYAIDRDAIVKARGFGFKVPVQQMSFPNSPSYIKNLAERTYNPEKAKQLLAEAGYPNGFETTISASSAVISDKDELVAVQGFLSKVGINAKINYIDQGTYAALRASGWNGLLMTLTGIDANLNTTIAREIAKASPFFASLAKTDEYDALYQKSLVSREYDPALMQQIVQYIFDTAMVNYLWTGTSLEVVNPYVQGTGHYTLQVWSQWLPGNAWLNK
jgi:peptide/nickel transport system substrate-binding protein